MENFVFKNGTRIIFGKGSENQIGACVSKYSDKVLIHYGGKSLEKYGVLDRVKTSLKESGIEYVVLDGVVPNPRLSLVKKGIEICKKENIKFVLAVGGGSAIDSAKAIALGAKYNGDVWDFYSGKAEPMDALKVGTILTIPGSGSEMSDASIITKEEGNFKCVAGSELIVPEFSILNPEMCYTIPSRLMAAGIADIMSHLFERYFSPTKSVELSDRLLEGAMKAVMEIGPKILKDPTNYDYCSEVMWLATVSHNGMLDAGRVTDWSSHRIEHEISALYDITHGAGMAIVFPAWMKHVKHENLEKFVQMATRVFDVDNAGAKEEIATRGIEAVENFFKSLNLEITLTSANIPVNDFKEMAKKALGENENLGSFKKLNAQDIVKILELSV